MPGWSTYDLADCCCGGACSTTICAKNCSNGNINGALVTIESGATTIDSGTTDVSGCVTLTIPSAGSYTVVVTQGPTTLFSGTKTLTCGGTVTFNCFTALPNTIYFTFGGVTVALTRTGGTWSSNCTTTVSSVGFATYTGPPGFERCTSCGNTGNVPISFAVSCPDAGGNVQVAMGYPMFNCQSATPQTCCLYDTVDISTPCTCGVNATGVSAEFDCSAGTVSISGSFPADGNGACCAGGNPPFVVPLGGGPFTVTS
jgi:hypothetical protein